MVAWMSRPQITVTVYIPSWLPMVVMSSISTILPAIRNRIPIGAYLGISGCESTSEPVHSMSTPIHPSWYLPHNYSHKPHDGLIERVKEVFEGLTLLLHVPDDQTKAYGEHHQAERIDSIDRPRHWDHLLVCYHTAAIGCEYGVIHRHRHVDNLLGILRLELGLKRKMDRLD